MIPKRTDTCFVAQVDKPRAIPLELNTLLAARNALDKEIGRIVAVVSLICCLH